MPENSRIFLLFSDYGVQKGQTPLNLFSQYNRYRLIPHTHSVNSHIDQLKKVFSRPYASASFYFCLSVHFFHNHFDNFRCSSMGLEAGEKTGAGFYEIYSRIYAAVASPSYLLLI